MTVFCVALRLNTIAYTGANKTWRQKIQYHKKFGIGPCRCLNFGGKPVQACKNIPTITHVPAGSFASGRMMIALRC